MRRFSKLRLREAGAFPVVWLCVGAIMAVACTSSLDPVKGEYIGVGGSGSGTGGDVHQGGDSTMGGGGAGAGAPDDINVGWIGGPCSSDAECNFEGGFCLTEDEGFPNGMCAMDCTQFCPDADDAVTTFCAPPDRLGLSDADYDAGLCTTRCDYGQSPTGCRDGYQCQVVERYGDADTQVYACVPGDDDPFVLGACHQELLERGVPFTPALSPDDSPEGRPDIVCEIEEPIYVSPYLAGVAFHPASLNNAPTPIFTRCAHALAMLDSAEVLAEAEVDALVHYGVYNCRTIAGSSTVSQHGYANAIDIAGVRKDGQLITVLSDWEMNEPDPQTHEGQLLRGFVETLHGDMTYNIILTPDYDEAHEDHFHCDLTDGAHFLE